MIDIFESGTNFVNTAGTVLCLNGHEELKKVRIKIIKDKVVQYLKTHDKIRISDLSEKLDAPPRLIGEVLNELESEGIIKTVD